jgi:hypothetical protein
MVHTIIWGILLLLIGAWLWLAKLGYLSFDLARDWPVIIIIVGLFTVIEGIVYFVRRKR